MPIQKRINRTFTTETARKSGKFRAFSTWEMQEEINELVDGDRLIADHILLLASDFPKFNSESILDLEFHAQCQNSPIGLLLRIQDQYGDLRHHAVELVGVKVPDTKVIILLDVFLHWFPFNIPSEEINRLCKRFEDIQSQDEPLLLL